MCLFIETLWVKKCRHLSGWKYFPITVNISTRRKSVFVLLHLLTKIRGNIIHICNLFDQLVVNMGTYLPKKRTVRKNNSCLMANTLSKNS